MKFCLDVLNSLECEYAHSDIRAALGNGRQSLLNVIDFTYTKMGKRLLKSRISSPIFDEKILNERYNSIEKLIHNNKYAQYQKYLKYIGDIEKKYRKLVLQVGTRGSRF